MAQGDQGGGGGKRKNKNRNRNRNRNKQANTANQQPTPATEPEPTPVAVTTEKPACAPESVSPPTSAPSASDTIAAQHQLPIFDSSSKTFVTNTFLPSYATVNADSRVVDDGLPDVGTLSSSDEEPAKATGKQKCESAKQSDSTQAKVNKYKEDANELEKEAKKLENKIDDIERQNKLIGNLTMELKSRPDLGNWPAIRDAERDYVNTQHNNKKNRKSVKKVDTSDDDFEHVKKWSQDDEKRLEKNKEILKGTHAELIKNLKLEMSSNPYLANWGQIADAETRLSSSNGNTQHNDSKKEGPQKNSKRNKNKKVEASAAEKKEENSDDDIDFFASDEDEEPKPKPKMVAPKPRAAPANTPKNKKPAEKDNSKSFGPPGSIAAEIAKARQHIKNSLECVDNLGAMAGNEELLKKVASLEIENKSLKKVTDDLKNLVIKLENRVANLEQGKGGSAPAPAKAPAKVEEEDDDDDVDLFGSDSEDEETKAEKERVTAERLKAYHEKKSKKPALIAKTSVLLDIKPWDDETDMNEMLKSAKSIEKEGLVWGASKLVPVGYGINKLQLMCVVEDEKVSIDELCEQISEFEDFVQSVDVAAMSKI